MKAGVDEDRAGAGVADQEGGAGDGDRVLAGEEGAQQLRRQHPAAGADHHRPRPFDVAGDDRFDRDGGAAGAAGERLVQGVRFDADSHRGGDSYGSVRL
jgi:hypothetical protein